VKQLSLPRYIATRLGWRQWRVLYVYIYIYIYIYTYTYICKRHHSFGGFKGLLQLLTKRNRFRSGLPPPLTRRVFAGDAATLGGAKVRHVRTRHRRRLHRRGRARKAAHRAEATTG